MVTVKDLADHCFTEERSNEVLYCEICENLFSANKGDYWNLPENYVFKCCDCEMLLVVLK
jgi:hypothetical protein